jgi:hypothetical protein
VTSRDWTARAREERKVSTRLRMRWERMVGRV